MHSPGQVPFTTAQPPPPALFPPLGGPGTPGLWQSGPVVRLVSSTMSGQARGWHQLPQRESRPHLGTSWVAPGKALYLNEAQFLTPVNGEN